MVAASMAMLADKRSRRHVRMSARVSFALGILASVAANVAAAEPTVAARLVASWPALALLLTVELLSRTGRPDIAGTADIEADTSTPNVRPSHNGQARTSTRTTGRTSTGGTAAERLAKVRISRPDATAAELARSAGVSERHARRLLAELDAVGVAVAASEGAESGR